MEGGTCKEIENMTQVVPCKFSHRSAATMRMMVLENETIKTGFPPGSYRAHKHSCFKRERLHTEYGPRPRVSWRRGCKNGLWFWGVVKRINMFNTQFSPPKPVIDACSFLPRQDFSLATLFLRKVLALQFALHCYPKTLHAHTV